MEDMKDDRPWPLEKEATHYLEKHKIIELLNNLTAQLIYERPDNPKDFLIEQLDLLQKARTTRINFPCLFDDSNIKALFGMLDPTGTGFITLQHYKEAMKTLGVEQFDFEPPGGVADKVSFDTFIKEVKVGLDHSSAAFNENI